MFLLQLESVSAELRAALFYWKRCSTTLITLNISLAYQIDSRVVWTICRILIFHDQRNCLWNTVDTTALQWLDWLTMVCLQQTE